jgi:hypothetical protein
MNAHHNRAVAKGATIAKTVSPRLRFMVLLGRDMPTETVIAALPPSDGREWDCQCARCGSSADFVDCDTCGGEGYVDEYDDEWMEQDSYRCDVCCGRGGWQECISSREFCKQNPLPGREDVKPGKIEWYTLDPPKVSTSSS